MQDDVSKSKMIVKSVERVLGEGAIAVLATLIDGSSGVGAKLLIEESGFTTGSLNDEALDSAVGEFVTRFIESRDEAHTIRVAEFAPQLADLADTRILFERIEPEPRIVICGAGHVGASLAKLASFVGYRTTLIDDRAEFVTSERFPEENIEPVAAKSWADAVREAIGIGRGVAVAVVTRGHNEDEECLRAVITTNADY